MLDAIRCSFESSLLFVACSLSSRAQVASTLQSLHVLPCGSWGPDVHPTHTHAVTPRAAVTFISFRVQGQLEWCSECSSFAGAMVFIIGHLAIESSMPFMIPIRMCAIICFIITGCIALICSRICLRWATSSLMTAATASAFLLPVAAFILVTSPSTEASVHRLHLGHHLLVMGHHGFFRHVFVHHARLAQHFHILRVRRRRLLRPQGHGADADERNEEDRDRSTYLHGRVL